MTEKASDSPVKCDQCGEFLANIGSYYSHRNKQHGPKRATVKCPIAGCELKFTTVKKMNEHVKKKHKEVASSEDTKIEFESDDDFKVWLYELQQNSKAQFVLHRGRRAYGDRTTYNFYCNRSGTKDKRLSIQKNPQSTAKIDAYCTAYFKATVFDDGKVKIEGSLYHAGHELELNKLRMPPEIVQRIEHYLNAGWTPQSILEKVQSESDIDSREHYVQIKDITYYLKARMPERVYRFHERDEESLAIMIDFYDGTEGQDTPFFYYQPETDDNSSFKLGIQTKEMRRMMDKYGNGVICTDTTHSLTTYPDLLFGTILVVDESGAGQPGAFFFVKSESREELTPILKALQKRHTKLKPSFFMSDYNNAFWNTWCDTFGPQSPDTQRVLCDWHLWRCWNKNLNAKVSCSKNRLQLRQSLSLLQYSLNQPEFEFRWSVLVDRLMKHPSLTQFGSYFTEKYGGKMVTTWAKYTRSRCEVNTNMHLEGLHRVLKYKFLERQCNRRLDYTCGVLIHKVSSYYTHSYNETIIMKRVSSNRQHLASSDHERSLYYLDKPDALKELSDNTWIIQSEKAENTFYNIRRLPEFKRDQHFCLLCCRYCSVCCHEFRCDCMRNKRSGHVPCKHIHALQMLFGCHYPPRRHDDVKDLLADQASVLFDDVPAAPATDDAVLPPSTTESCTDNLDVLSVEDVDLPSSCEENLDGASSKIRSSISSSISLLQQRLQKLDKFAQSAEATEEQLKIALQQLQHCSRVVNEIPLAKRRPVLAFGRRSRKRVIERQPRSFTEARIAKAKERLRSGQLLPLPRKKVRMMEKRIARWAERDKVKNRLKDMLNTCREMNL